MTAAAKDDAPKTIAADGDNPADQAAPAAAIGKTAKVAKAGKKVRVTIHSGGDSEEEKGDVVLVHNYRQIQIQRNKEVLISEEFLEVLKHAAIDTTSVNNQGEKTGGKTPRFSYTVEPE